MKLTTVDVNSWETLASDTMCGFWMAWFQMLELNMEIDGLNKA